MGLALKGVIKEETGFLSGAGTEVQVCLCLPSARGRPGWWEMLQTQTRLGSSMLTCSGCDNRNSDGLTYRQETYFSQLWRLKSSIKAPAASVSGEASWLRQGSSPHAGRANWLSGLPFLRPKPHHKALAQDGVTSRRPHSKALPRGIRLQHRSFW